MRPQPRPPVRCVRPSVGSRSPPGSCQRTASSCRAPLAPRLDGVRRAIAVDVLLRDCDRPAGAEQIRRRTLELYVLLVHEHDAPGQDWGVRKDCLGLSRRTRAL